MPRSATYFIAIVLICSVVVSSPALAPLASGTAVVNVDVSRVRPLDYVWQPIVYGDYFRQCYPPAYEVLHAGLVEAVMTQQASFTVPDETTLYELEFIFKTTFPVYFALIATRDYVGGTVFFTYVYERTAHDGYLADFAAQMATIINAAVQAEDTPTMAALALYNHYVSLITYDYEAAQDESMKDVSTLRALVDFEGICQSFASAYAYLLLQLDINAAPIGGLNSAGQAHEWTFVELSGASYHCDPTYENGMESGLRYFGMTNDERFSEDGYDPLTFNLANANSKMGVDVVATDARFAALWAMDHLETFVRTATGAEIFYVDRDGMGQTVTFR